MESAETNNAYEAQNKPMPLPVLRKGRDGWSGKAENFNVRDNVIKIKVTDANPSYVPTVEQRQLTMDEEGNFSQHVQLNASDDLFQLWMCKIGPYLADWGLNKNPYGAFIAGTLLAFHSHILTFVCP
jgi:hypothetical protein